MAARSDGPVPRTPLHYVTKHLQHGIESDRFRVKKNIARIVGLQFSALPGRPSSAPRLCSGCARAPALPARRPPASKTTCSQFVLTFPRRTKLESGKQRSFSALCLRLRHALRYDRSATNYLAAACIAAAVSYWISIPSIMQDQGHFLKNMTSRSGAATRCSVFFGLSHSWLK